MQGMDTFRTYVNGRYDTRLQNIICASGRSPEISRMIASVLAGYAWDTANPFVAKHGRGLNALAEAAGGISPA